MMRGWWRCLLGHRSEPWQRIHSDEYQSALRLIYITLARERDRAIAPPLVFALSLSNEQKLTLQLVNARAHELERVIARWISPELSHPSEIEIESANDNMLQLVKQYGPTVGLDYGLLYSWQIVIIFKSLSNKKRSQYRDNYASFLASVVQVGAQAGEHELAATLTNQRIPPVGAEAHAWQQLADNLHRVMQHKRQLEPPLILARTQIELLNDYFRTNALLLQCLKSAVVPNRQVLEEGLLLPPGEWERKFGKG